MRTVRSGSVRPEAMRALPNFAVLIRFSFLSLFLILVLLGSVLTVLMITPFSTSSREPNPFAEYEAFMPGQPAAILEQYPRTCQMIIPSEFNSILCQLSLDKLVSITVNIRKDVIFSLSIKGSDWRFEDLVMRWGLPDTMKPIKGVIVTGYPDGAVSVNWSDYHAYAVLAPLSAGHLWNQSTPVWYMHIESGE